MKAIGLVGAGIGSASLAAPIFHDVDELISSQKSIQRRPWYVKERDLYNPTVEVDWEMTPNRYDPRFSGQAAYVRAMYYGKDRVLTCQAKGAAENAKRMAAGQSGFTVRDQALTLVRKDVERSWTGAKGVTIAKTPQERGEPKWTGTPEEASRMLNAAMRFFGGALFGYGELDQRMRTKVVNSHSRGNVWQNTEMYIDKSNWTDAMTNPIVYEDVDLGYSTPTKLVIPLKNMYWICADFPGGKHQYQAAPSLLANGRGPHDNLRVLFYPSFSYFMRYLGYQTLGTMQDGWDAVPDNSTAILGGIAEENRQGVLSLTPEMALAHSSWTLLTDLPVAPTKPIDAGIFRFCQRCGKCAETCPAGTIPMGDPSWEAPPVDGKENIMHHLGRKSYFGNGALCWTYIYEAGHGCKQCIGNCSFMVGSGAMVHELVKGAAAATGLFNGFFYSMSKSFDYGLYNPEDWWDQSLPIMGFDSTIVSYDGGYRK